MAIIHIYIKMGNAYKFMKMIEVDPDIIKGLEQINSLLKKIQLEEGVEIINFQKDGNMYTLLCQKTTITEERDAIQDDIGTSE